MEIYYHAVEAVVFQRLILFGEAVHADFAYRSVEKVKKTLADNVKVQTLSVNEVNVRISFEEHEMLFWRIEHY
ncbi:hypothetical protein FN924_04895 [Radiobacillus deserti]|uniref:Uncharacterized protein n=2 Tax=Radiobacillus deserti TaxID=2594883 RepID=A0A516KDT5_9BACI|nr:hypothetical protein FN924_04895 [Radiobacillus deserti]